MALKDLRRFGPIRKIFKGNGLAGFKDGNEVKATFTLVQLIDTQLLFIVNFKRPIGNFIAVDHEVISITGKLIDGRSVSIRGLSLTESKTTLQGKTHLIGHSSHWVIGEPNFKEVASITFELVNFRFLGTESEVFINGDERQYTRSLMTLKVAERKIKLRWVADYDQVVASLKAQRGVQVTCTASTTIKDSTEIDIVVSLIDVLCDVMTVARGTLVSWTSFDISFIENELIYSRYRNSVTRPFTGNELINNFDGQYTKSFLERGFSRCQEIAPDFQIRMIARAFTETRDGPFIESRSLLIGVLIEYIATVRVRLGKSNINSFNRYTLRWKINNLGYWLDVKFEKGEVEIFVDTRNNLVHEGRFPQASTPIEHYQRMQHLMDRVLLRLFDYHGPYYDIEHREIRQI